MHEKSEPHGAVLSDFLTGSVLSVLLVMLCVFLFLLEAATLGGLLSGGGTLLSALIVGQKISKATSQADATVVRATNAMVTATKEFGQNVIQASVNLNEGMRAVAHSLQNISDQRQREWPPSMLSMACFNS